MCVREKKREKYVQKDAKKITARKISKKNNCDSFTNTIT